MKRNKKLKKIAYVTLVGDDLNDGHKNILKVASKYGEVIVGLMTDKASLEYTSLPHFKYAERESFVKKNKLVKKIIPQNSLDNTENLKRIKPNYVIHGDDWKTGYQKKTRIKVINTLKKWSGKLIEIKYTKKVSSSSIKKRLVKKFMKVSK